MGLQPVSDSVVDQNLRYLERLIKTTKPLVTQVISGEGGNKVSTVFNRSWVGLGLEWISRKLNVKPAVDAGINVTVAGVSVKRKADKGIGCDSNGIYIILKSGGGIAVDASGLYLTAVSAAWPIGAVFLSIVATNPATLLGFGTWSQIAQGQMLVGLKTGDPDFGIVEGTGGSKTASHDHNHDGAAVDSHVVTQPTAHGTVDIQSGSGATVLSNTNNHSGAAVADHTVTQPTAHTDHDILNPYFTVYIWKRTA